VTLGADLSVAAGPVGRSAEASTDLDLEAEIYSYSRSKGLFAGVSIKGASIQIDKDANKAFYGDAGANAHDILYDPKIKAPDAVEDKKAPRSVPRPRSEAKRSPTRPSASRRPVGRGVLP
jgi:lipid-binding SYLF domain-containing protein